MNAVQRAVDSLSSDSQGAAVVDELFNKLENTKSDIDGLIRELSQSPYIRMRSVRAIITRLAKSPDAKRRDPAKGPSYIRFASVIIDNKAHMDHLSLAEWRSLCTFLCEYQRGLGEIHDRLFIKLSMEVFRLIQLLLKQFESVDDSCFSDILNAAASFPYLAEETSAHPFLLGCVRYIYLLSSHGNDEIAEFSRVLGMSIIETGPFRNSELKEEVFALCSIIENATVSNDFVKKHIANMDGYTISEKDVEFSSSVSSWIGTRYFRARPFAPLAPFLASRSLAALFEMNRTNSGCLFSLELITDTFCINKYVLQALCFMDFTLTSEEVRYLLTAELEGPERFWVFALISFNGLDDLPMNELLLVWRDAAARLNDPLCGSAASYLVARCAQKLIHFDPLETRIVHLLISLLWQLNASTPFSSGSLFLYRTIKELNIVDSQLQRQLCKLDEWYATQLSTWLESPDPIGYSLELVGAFKGETHDPMYAGKIFEMSQELEYFRPSPKQISSVVPFEETLGCVESLTDTPANEKMLMWLSIKGSSHLNAAQLDYVQSPRFRSEMESFVLYTFTSGPSDLPPSLACMAESWPELDDFDILVHRAKELLLPGPILVETFAAHSHFPDSRFTTSFLGDKVLSSYMLQRCHKSLTKMVIILDSIKRSEIDQHIVQDVEKLQSFLVKVALQQSKFSRLRMSLASFTDGALFDLIRTSCDDLTVQMSEKITFDDDLYSESESELERFLEHAATRRPLVRDAIILGCARSQVDLFVTIEFCAYLELESVILALANQLDVSPRMLLFFTGRAVLERWHILRGDKNFPFHLFNAEPCDFFQLLPFPVRTGCPKDMCTALDVLSEFVDSPHGQLYSKRKRDSFDLDAWVPFILFKCLPLVRVPITDWEGFPVPKQSQFDLATFPDFPNVSPGSVEWVIEESFNAVAAFASTAAVYVVVRRCWNLYKFYGRPQTALKTLLRAVLAHNRVTLRPVLLQLIRLCSHELDPALAAEVACSIFPDRDILEALEPCFRPYFDSEAFTVLDFLYNQRSDHVLSLLEGNFEALELEFPFYKAFIPVMMKCNMEGRLKDISPKRAQHITSNLLFWTRVLQERSEGWSLWAADLILAIGQKHDQARESLPSVSNDPQLALVQTIYQHVQKHDYNVFRWLVPYLRQIPAARELFPTLRAVLPKSYPRRRFPLTNLRNSLNEQLASIFDRHSPTPLDVGHMYLPDLAGELLPFLYQDLLESDPSAAQSLIGQLESLVDIFASVKKVIVNAYLRAHLVQTIPRDRLEALVIYAHDLKMDTEALLFAELLNESTNLDPGMLVGIFKGLDDPDIQSGLHSSVNLKSVTPMLDPWSSTQIDISRFEAEGTSGIRAFDEMYMQAGSEHIFEGQQNSGAGKLYHSFKEAGMTRLANMIQRPSLYDYESAFKLQQWHIPAAKKVTTEPQMLFNFFRDIRNVDWGSKISGTVSNFLTLDTISESTAFASLKKHAFELACASEDASLQTVRDILCIMSPRGPISSTKSENSRWGRQILLSWKGDYLNQAKELSQSCVEARLARDTTSCVSLTVRLENLSSFLDSDNPLADSIGLLSLIESAQTSWLLGNQSDSIAMLKQAVSHTGFFSRRGHQIYDPCVVLCTLASWTSQSRSETDSTIEKTLLEPAIQNAHESSEHTQELVFHTFAKFCDDRYRDPLFIKEIKDAKRLVTTRDARQKETKEKLRTASQKERKYWESKYSRERSLLEVEYRDYQHLMSRRIKFVSRALKMYTDSLAVGDKYTLNDSSRIVSLWLSNTNSNDINEIVDEALGKVPTFKWLSWLNQLTSCMADDDSSFQKVLKRLLKMVCLDHPYHAIWYIQALTQGDPADPRAMSRNAAGSQLWASLSQIEDLEDTLNAVKSFCSQAIILSAEKVPPEERSSFSFRRLKSRQGNWWKEKLPKLKVPIPTKTLKIRADRAYFDVPVFRSVESKVTIASGISAPKIVRAFDSWGELNTMLFKDSKDDLRQDAIMEQVFGQSNAFFARDPEARKRGLSVRTYNVVSLSPTSGVIEFVTDTRSLYDILDPLHRTHDDKAWTAKRARELMGKAYPKGKEARLKTFEEICTHIKPVLRFFFFEKFRSAEAWLKARTAYSRSAAASSILGHILGLGDRHCSNILLDLVTGEVVHIDLGIAFDQGQALRIPETVPFRLSRDIVDGFGSTGYQGIFSRCAEITMNLLREQQDDIFTILDVLLYDPLYQWRLSPFRGNAIQDGTFNSKPSVAPNHAPAKPESDEAERALRGVRKKLTERLSSEATVRQLIQQASSMENLALLFEGWAPFY